MSWVVENTLLAVMLALVAMLVCRLVRPRPALAHLLWLAVVLRLVCPPLPFAVELPVRDPFGARAAPVRTAPTPARRDRAPVADAASIASEPRPPQPALSPSVASHRATRTTTHGTPASALAPAPWRWLPWLWVAGSALAGAVILLGVARTRHRLRSARPAPDSLRRAVESLARRLGVTPPEIVVVRDLNAPFVWSAGRPRLAWPSHLPADSRSARGLIAHELAHLRRRDHWVARGEVVAAIAFFWHPLFWLARARMRDCAERACDAWAVWAVPEGRRDYARALIDAVGASNPESKTANALPALGAGHGARRAFEERLTMILHHDVKHGLSRWTAAPIAALTLFALAGVSFAQNEPPPKPGPELERRVAERIEQRVLEIVGDHLERERRVETRGEEAVGDERLRRIVREELRAALAELLPPGSSPHRNPDTAVLAAPRTAAVPPVADTPAAPTVRALPAAPTAPNSVAPPAAPAAPSPPATATQPAPSRFAPTRAAAPASAATPAPASAPRASTTRTAPAPAPAPAVAPHDRSAPAAPSRRGDSDAAVRDLVRTLLMVAGKALREDGELRELGLADRAADVVDALAKAQDAQDPAAMRPVLAKSLDLAIDATRAGLHHHGVPHTELAEHLRPVLHAALEPHAEADDGRMLTGSVEAVLRAAIRTATDVAREHHPGKADQALIDDLEELLETALDGAAQGKVRIDPHSLSNSIRAVVERTRATVPAADQPRTGTSPAHEHRHDHEQSSGREHQHQHEHGAHTPPPAAGRAPASTAGRRDH